MTTENNLKEVILEQNWLHVRHIEDERLKFTEVYMALIVGIIYVVYSNNNYSTTFFLILYGIVISIFGIAVMLKVQIEFYYHLAVIKKIHGNDFKNYCDYVIPDSLEKCKDFFKIQFNVGSAFNGLYVTTISLLFAILFSSLQLFVLFLTLMVVLYEFLIVDWVSEKLWEKVSF